MLSCFYLHQPEQSNRALDSPKPPSRPARTGRHRESASFILSVLEALEKSIFPSAAYNCCSHFSPSLIHYNHSLFSPPGVIVACPDFHKAAQPLVSVEICTRRSFASEETLHHLHCLSDDVAASQHYTCFKERLFPRGTKCRNTAEGTAPLNYQFRAALF